MQNLCNIRAVLLQLVQQSFAKKIARLVQPLQHLCNLCNICELLIEQQLVVQCSCTKLVRNLCNLSINLVQNSCNIGCKTCAIRVQIVQHFCARFLQHVQNLFKTSTTILFKLCNLFHTFNISGGILQCILII